ncbi:MAG TPA: CinA family protein [Phenylobacterium sp.]|nr:CinA family protein [Phenylobacterium sp.]HMP62155.1 CinA family protein [Phenylobacterium sp.]
MDDLMALGRGVGAQLKARGETVAVAESSSGGLISAALLGMGGASAYYLGGGVIYTGKARMSLLEIPREAVAGMRSASEPYALLLARTVRERFGATWGVSETGAAGPSGNGYGDPAGHSCIAISGPVEWVTTLETGADDRLANMQAFAAGALDLLRRATAD